MTTIGEAGNTLVPAALALEQLGFDVHATPERTVATRGELRIVASDPLTALGLATIVDVRGNHWQATDHEIDAWLPRLVR